MKIAVIGTGVAGLGAAWLLHKRHDLTVYEAGDHVGGHANTVETPRGTAVDTGFIVYNEATYPNLIRLFSTLAVPTEVSDMSFGASLDGGRTEYSSNGLGGLFADRRNYLSLRFHRMWLDILRFYRNAPAALAEAWGGEQTLGAYLARHRYSRPFVEDHLLPMAAAIWSTRAEQILDFPLRSFVAFFQNHGLLKLAGRPQWRTVTGGSREYVARMTAPFRDRIRLSTPVRSIRRTLGGILIEDATGAIESFDHAVIATHADQALELLADRSDREQAVLGAFRYQPNEAVLHGDVRLMPKRQRAWASWNYMAGKGDQDGDRSLSVTYWMNLLQNLDRSEPLFVSLNSPVDPDPALVYGRYSYAHPLFDLAAIRAQKQMATIQGARRTWFCGSYLGYGFHEDALSAGLAVGEALGGRRPWIVTDASPAGRNAMPAPLGPPAQGMAARQSAHRPLAVVAE